MIAHPAGLSVEGNPTRPPIAKPVRYGWYLYGVLFLVILGRAALETQTFGIDSFAYWSAAPPLYDGNLGGFGTFPYSPAFYQLVLPLQTFDWVGFAWLWAALSLGTAVWLGPIALASPGTALDIYHGNIHLFMAAAIVLGFRHPWTWAFILLTKVTPGVGLLWFVVRREWQSLAIALGATAAVVALSIAIAPDLWTEWLTFLSRARSPFGPPLWLRLPLAALLVVWGARTDRRWTVPVAAMVALPNPWWTALAMLGAIPLLVRSR
jgi:hypothetical protein